MERSFEVVSLNSKDLGSLRKCNEGLVKIVLYQEVRGGFDEFCKAITTRNDRREREKLIEIKELAYVAGVQ
jgi:hypothetical protein